MSQLGKIKRIQIVGGFLSDLDLEFADGLNCIIGARGTGKTTLLEAVRFAFTRSPEQTLGSGPNNLLRENLQGSPIKIEFEFDAGGIGWFCHGGS